MIKYNKNPEPLVSGLPAIIKPVSPEALSNSVAYMQHRDKIISQLVLETSLLKERVAQMEQDRMAFAKTTAFKLSLEEEKVDRHYSYAIKDAREFRRRIDILEAFTTFVIWVAVVFVLLVIAIKVVS